MNSAHEELSKCLPTEFARNVQAIAESSAPEESVERIILQQISRSRPQRLRASKRVWISTCVGCVVIVLLLLVNGRSVIVAPVRKFVADYRLQQLQQERSNDPKQEAEIRAECLALAVQNTDLPVGLAAAFHVGSSWPGTAEAGAAMQLLMNAAAEMPLDKLANGLDRSSVDQREHWYPLASALMERAKGEPNHPRAAKLLCEAAVIYWPRRHQDHPPEELISVADLIRNEHLKSDDLANFCEVAGNLGNPTQWTQAFESHIRDILATNTDRFVRCQAHMALTSIVRAGGIARQEEAAELCRQFLEEFDGKTQYSATSVEFHNRGSCERYLAAIKTHGLGVTPPETTGLDLYGKPLSMSDYRGRVVLVSFWATWCPPCLEAVRQERKLLTDFGKTNFAIVGMNGDSDMEVARTVAEKYGITWRSFQMNGQGAAHPKWPSEGFPTFYLLNRKGVIVRNWLGTPSESELRDAIQSVI